MHCLSVFCRVVALPANLDFMTFNHRGKLFAPELEAKFTKSWGHFWSSHGIIVNSWDGKKLEVGLEVKCIYKGDQVSNSKEWNVSWDIHQGAQADLEMWIVILLFSMRDWVDCDWLGFYCLPSWIVSLSMFAMHAWKHIKHTIVGAD